MAICPRPDTTEKTAYDTTSQAPTPVTQSPGTPGTKTVNPPAARSEMCENGSSTVVTGPGAVNPPPPGGNSGTNTENTTQVPCEGTPGKGFKWGGEWAIGEDYKAQSDTNPNADVVYHSGAAWICIADNNSESADEPEHEPGKDEESWELMVSKGELETEDKSWLDQAKDGILDWFKNASPTDLLLAGAAAAGLIYAGTKIVDSLTNDGSDSPTGNGAIADARYDGSDGYPSTGYSAPDIKDVLAQLCAYVGVECDASLLPDQSCEFTIGNQTGVRSIIDMLALSFNFSMVDSAGVYRFVPRSTTPVKTILDADLGFVSDVNSLGEQFVVERAQGIDLPKKVTLQYYDATQDYAIFTQESDYFTYEEGQDVELSTPVTLTADQAKTIANQTLMNAHLERNKFTFQTSYKHIDLEPGDVVDSESMGLLRIYTISETEEGIIEIVSTDAADADSTEETEGLMMRSFAVETVSGVQPPPARTNKALTIGFSDGLFFDPPSLNDQDTGVRILAAIHGFGREGWPGAQIYLSENNGASYDLVTTVQKETTFGLVELAVGSGDYYGWDETTQFVVKLKTNALGSVSKLDVNQGRNWAMVGQEIIGFRNAELIADKTYRLSGLRRGMRGTETFVGSHAANELFVLLDDSVQIDFENKDRGTTKKYKVVTVGSAIDRVDGLDVEMWSNNTRCWPVTRAKVLKTGTDFTFTWKESVRFNDGLQDYAIPDHDSDWGGYGIVIYGNDGVTIKKVYTTQVENWTYTSNMQLADFGVVQNSVKASIAQMSRIWGAGYPVTINS